MTPFSASPELTLRIVTYTIDQRTADARLHARQRSRARRLRSRR